MLRDYKGSAAVISSAWEENSKVKATALNVSFAYYSQLHFYLEAEKPCLDALFGRLVVVNHAKKAYK
jgi:hypothetical protein